MTEAVRPKYCPVLAFNLCDYPKNIFPRDMGIDDSQIVTLNEKRVLSFPNHTMEDQTIGVRVAKGHHFTDEWENSFQRGNRNHVIISNGRSHAGTRGFETERCTFFVNGAKQFHHIRTGKRNLFLFLFIIHCSLAVDSNTFFSYNQRPWKIPIHHQKNCESVFKVQCSRFNVEEGLSQRTFFPLLRYSTTPSLQG